jgi:type IV secretion system protein VirD4
VPGRRAEAVRLPRRRGHHRGGPRTGKTALIGALIIDHPGAVISTSTRKELYELTHGARRKRGPVYIFNPGGLGGLASTITFDPIRGCDDPAVALARATDMVGSDDGGDKDRKFWNDQASRVLGALLHAAALGKRTMTDIQQWVAEPKQNASDIEKLLRRSVIPAIVINDFRQFIGINDRTQTSITTAMTPALAWLSHPSAREAAAPSNFPFDVRQLIEEHATIYLLGKEEAHTAALVGALTGEIGRQALLIAAEQVGGRLDPSLLMALDEAANICPVALDSWTSHFGGSGITIVAAFQSRLQMVKRWGKVSAGIILNNTAAVVLLGGTKDEEDLRYWSSLADKRDEVTVTRNAQGKVTSKSVRKVDVFTVQQLSSLPQWHVVVFRRNLLPCVGVITPAWKRDALRYPDGRPVARAARAAWAYTNATPAVPPQDSYPLPPEPADEEQPADTNQPAA